MSNKQYEPQYKSLGDFIRNLRVERGIKQRELAYGILSVSNLSRLENGEQLPSKDKLDAILQRLGLNSKEIYSYFLDDKEYEINKKCDDLLSLIANNKNQEAEIILNELSLLYEFKEGIKKQFLLSCKAVLMIRKKQDNDEVKKIVQEALKITIKDFSEETISEKLLTDQEVNLINILSVIYSNENKLDKAIEILENLKKVLDFTKIDEKQRPQFYTLILFNLSKYYGLTNRYLIAKEICDIGEELCLKSNKMRQLPGFIYNKAYFMYEIGYREECKILLYIAYYGYYMMERTININIIKDYAIEKFGIDFIE